MRIFFVCQRVPFPPDRGDKITTFHEISHLVSNQHEVHVFCLADGAYDLKNLTEARRYATTVDAVRVGWLRKKLRMLFALVARKPISVAAFNEPKLHALFKRRSAELKPQLIFVYSGNMAQYAEASKTPRIMQFADLDSLKWGAYAEAGPVLLKWIYRMEKRRLLAYERRISRSFTHCLVCTAKELEDFEQLIPSAPVSVVGNGVDLDYFRSSGRPKRRGAIIFTGVMNYRPNVDAALWFCDEILPIVRSHISDATLTICGSSPTASIRSLARREGVIVTGRVPDTRPYLDSAELSVVPIKIARGIQNKVLEAMAMHLPVVTSTKVWRGTMIADGDGLLVADLPQQFAHHVVRLLEDSEYRLEMGRKARAAVEAHYCWDIQFTKLDEVISAVTNINSDNRRSQSGFS